MYPYDSRYRELAYDGFGHISGHGRSYHHHHHHHHHYHRQPLLSAPSLLPAVPTFEESGTRVSWADYRGHCLAEVRVCVPRARVRVQNAHSKSEYKNYVQKILRSYSITRVCFHMRSFCPSLQKQILEPSTQT